MMSMFHGLKGFSRTLFLVSWICGCLVDLAEARQQIPFGFFRAKPPTYIFSDGFESFTSGTPDGWTRGLREVAQDTTNVSQGTSAVSLGYRVSDETFGEIHRSIDLTGAGTLSIYLTAISNIGPCFSHLLVKIAGTTVIDSGGTGGPGLYTAAISYSGVQTVLITMSASNTCSGTVVDDLNIY